MASYTMPMPGPPTITSVTASNAAVVVAFAQPDYAGALPILGYVARTGLIVTTGPSSPLVLPGLVNGTATAVSVAASNAAGIGPWSRFTAPVTHQGARQAYPHFNRASHPTRASSSPFVLSHPTSLRPTKRSRTPADSQVQ